MDEKFNQAYKLILKQTIEKAPLIFISYDYDGQRLECMWKKINRKIVIEKGNAYYNPLNPYETIFMNDFEDCLSGCYHLLNLLYHNYHLGRDIKLDDYLLSKYIDDEEDSKKNVKN